MMITNLLHSIITATLYILNNQWKIGFDRLCQHLLTYSELIERYDYYIFLIVYLASVLSVNYLIEYSKEKGKNKATKNDITEITEKIEKARIEYSKELESFNSKLDKDNQIILASLNSYINAQQTFLQYKGNAIIKVWEQLRGFKKSMFPLIFFYDLRILSAVTSTSVKDFDTLILTNFFEAINEQRLFLEENLWKALNIYYSFFVQLYVNSKNQIDQSSFDFKWFKDDELLKYLVQLVPKKAKQLIEYNGPGHLHYTVNELENHLITEIKKVISGQDAVGTTIDTSLSIMQNYDKLTKSPK